MNKEVLNNLKCALFFLGGIYSIILVLESKLSFESVVQPNLKKKVRIFFFSFFYIPLIL